MIEASSRSACIAKPGHTYSGRKQTFVEILIASSIASDLNKETHGELRDKSNTKGSDIFVCVACRAWTTPHSTA
jgi:hypothetical protein